METEFKGTPGAWFATYDLGYSTWIIDVIDDKEQLVAFAIPDSKIESEANARLISPHRKCWKRCKTLFSSTVANRRGLIRLCQQGGNGWMPYQRPRRQSIKHWDDDDS